MRLAIVINTSWNIYNFRRGLLHAFKNEGAEIIAIAPKDNYSKLLEAEGFRFIPIEMDNKGSNPVKDLKLLKNLKRVYKEINPDIILHYTIKPNIYGTIAAHQLGIPVINNVSGLGTVFIRRNLISKIALKLYRYAFRFPERIFFQNKDDRQLFLENGLVQQNKTDLLPGSGINLDNYEIAPFVRQKPFTFLMISRLIVDKGVREYVAAAAILKEKGLEIDCQLVGFIDQENALSISKEELNRWQKDKIVNYLGSSEDIRNEIKQCDVVVLPSYREGTPRTLLEAAAMGKPLVSTDVPGCREVVKDGYNGYLCEAKNAENLAEKMQDILNLQDQVLGEFGKNSRRWVEERFAEKMVIDKYKKEIKAILDGKKRDGN